MSSAERYAEDFSRLERQVEDYRETIDNQRETIRSLETSVELHKVENTELHRQIAFERSRTDRFVRYCVAMSAYFETVMPAIEKARQMGLEASQEAARATLGDLTEEQKVALVSLASRLGPVHTNGSAE